MITYYVSWADKVIDWLQKLNITSIVGWMGTNHINVARMDDNLIFLSTRCN